MVSHFAGRKKTRLVAYGAALALVVLVLQAQASGQSGTPTPEGPLTFAGDVAPLLNEHCAVCHFPGGPAPFSVQTYEEVAPYARAIARAVSARVMPPWKPEPGFGGPFVGERRLDAEDIELLQRWALGPWRVEPGGRDASLFLGDLSLEPSPPRPEGAAVPDAASENAVAAEAPGWTLGEPDLIVRLPEAYVLEPGTRDVFRNFAVPLPVDERRFVKGIEFRPGNYRVTHHANMRIDRTNNSTRLDERDPAPGYDAIAAPTAEFPDGHFLGWTPGQAAPFLPDGMAWELAPGSTLAVEMHLVPSEDRAENVGFQVGIYFTDVAPTRKPVMMRLGRQDIDIPADAADHHVHDEYTLPVDVEVLSLQPHAHYRATEVKGYATLPDGSREWLLYIPDWDFHVQDLYRLTDPLFLPAGTTVHMEYTFDNSARNADNPVLPPVRVRWGQYTNDEMGDLHIQVLPRPDDFSTLERSIRSKELADDITGFRVLVERVPEDTMIRANLAASLMAVGQEAEALVHFREYVRLEPDAAVAHYSLATALAATGARDEAMAEFRRSLALDPDDAFAHFAHNGLGALLLERGDAEGALAAFIEAVNVDLNFAVGYNNIGVALERLGRRSDAYLAYAKGAEVDPEYLDARFNAGRLAEVQGRHADAERYYREGLTLAPEDLELAGRLAWLLATSEAVGAPAESLRLAERVAAARPGDAGALDTLAAAQAAVGDWEAAVRNARALLTHLRRVGEREWAAALEARLALYATGRPFLRPSLTP